jgi:pimeloyl-ACP methyl ester carboxylesterase
VTGTLRSFDGTKLAYLDRGEGPVVLLLHGFASDHRGNWVAPGIVDALIAAGRRVIAPDARGHGASDKPHDPARYADPAMARDPLCVLDHLGVTQADVVGYSMGGMTAARAAASAPARVRSLILSGVGGSATPLRPGGPDSKLAAALETENAASVREPMAKGFRIFAERSGADRRSLAAIERGNANRSPIAFEAIAMPALVLAGKDDALIQPPAELAARLADARLESVAGDHLSAVGEPAFKIAIVHFLTVGSMPA